MKSVTQPRNCFAALASKRNMSWVKKIAGCYLRDSSRRRCIQILSLSWLFSFWRYYACEIDNSFHRVVTFIDLIQHQNFQEKLNPFHSRFTHKTARFWYAKSLRNKVVLPVKRISQFLHFWPRATLKGPKRSFVLVLVVLGVETWVKNGTTNVTKGTKNVTKGTKNVTKGTKNVRKGTKNVSEIVSCLKWQNDCFMFFLPLAFCDIARSCMALL